MNTSVTTSHLRLIGVTLAGALLTAAAFAQPDLIWDHYYNWRSGGYAQTVAYNWEEGSLLVSGVISQYDGDEGYSNEAFPWVMRLAGEGAVAWRYEGAAARRADPPLITPCDWGGILVMGAVNPSEEQTPWHLAARKLDSESGEMIWEREYPTHELTSMRVCSAWNINDGNLLVFGWTHPAQFWVEPTEDRVFAMTISSEDGALSAARWIDGTERVTLSGVARTTDGGYLLVGKSGAPEPLMGGRAYAMRLNSSLEPVWAQEFEGEGDDRVTGIAPYVGGFYLLCANFDVELEMERSYILKVSLDGEVVWRREVGEDWRTYGLAIARTRGEELWVTGRCIPAGQYGPDKAWLAGVSADGDLLWQHQYGGSFYGSFYGVARTWENGAIVVGCGVDEANAPGDMQISVLWLGRYPSSVRNSAVPALSKLWLQPASPNPFNSTTIVKFSVANPGLVRLALCDLSGRALQQWTQDCNHTGEGRLVLDGSGLAAGVYWIQLEQNGIRVATRLALEK